MISPCFVEALQERKGKFLNVISTKMKIGKYLEIWVQQQSLIGKQSINDISLYCQCISKTLKHILTHFKRASGAHIFSIESN